MSTAVSLLCRKEHPGSLHTWRTSEQTLQSDVKIANKQVAVQMVVQGEKKRRWKAVAKLLYCLSDFPQLYIFSTSDHVIPCDSIKAWIKVPLFCHYAFIYQPVSDTTFPKESHDWPWLIIIEG